MKIKTIFLLLLISLQALAQRQRTVPSLIVQDSLQVRGPIISTDGKSTDWINYVPNFWPYRENPNNPITKISDLPFSTSQHYVPNVIMVQDTLRLLTKTEGVLGCLYSYSANKGDTWTIDTVPILDTISGGNQAWIAEFEIFRDYSQQQDSVFVFYKGATSGSAPNTLGWFAASSPVNGFPSFQNRRSIFTAQDLATALGTTTDSIEDNAVSDVFRSGDTLYYFGYGAQKLPSGNSQFFIFLATSLGAGQDVTFEKVLLRSDEGYTIAGPCVFQFPGQPNYTMIYDSRSDIAESTENSELVSAFGTSLRSWRPNDGYFLTFGTNAWSTRRMYAGSLLKDSINNLEPLVLKNNELQYYASGSTNGIGDQSGLFYFKRQVGSVRNRYLSKEAIYSFVDNYVSTDTGLVRTTGQDTIRGKKYFREVVIQVSSGEALRVETPAGSFLLLVNTNHNVAVKKMGIGNSYVGITPPSNGLIVEGFTGIGLSDPTSQLDVGGDLEVALSDFHYWGDPTTNGSYRLGFVSDDFVLQERVAGTWTIRSTIYNAP